MLTDLAPSRALDDEPDDGPCTICECCPCMLPGCPDCPGAPSAQRFSGGSGVVYRREHARRWKEEA